MAQVIGSINTINGSFFIKSADGVVSVAKVGDTINSGDVIIGSGSNNTSNLLTVALNDNSKLINIIGDNQQLFDETMLGLELNSDTVVQNGELNESLLLDSNAQADAQQPKEEATLTLQEIEKLDAAAAGGETTPSDGSSGVLLARLEDRTGAEVDINTDLRDTSTLDALTAVETAEIIESAEIIETAEVIQPVPLLNAVFSFIGNVTVVEGSGTATISASLNQTPVTPLIITLSNGSTITFGTDYVVGTPVASTPFAIQGDDVYIDPESYNLSVSSTTGGGFASVDSSATGTVIVTDTIDNTNAILTSAIVGTENSATVTYTVTLDTAPTANETFTFKVDGVAQLITVNAGSTTGTTTLTITDPDVFKDVDSVSKPTDFAIADTDGVSNYEQLTLVNNATAHTAIETTDNVTIKLLALDSNGDIITSDDGSYIFTNEVVEGDSAKYMAVLVDSNGDIIADNGTVDIAFTNGSAKGVDSSTLPYSNDGTEDYVNNIQSVHLGVVFSVDTILDSSPESNEIFTVSLVENSFSNASIYENVVIDLQAVTTTIIDPDTIPSSFDEEQTLTFKFNGIITNLAIILDTSGSMDDIPSGSSITRLELAQNALENLINAYQDMGTVNVKLVTFATDAISYVWTTAENAINIINGLTANNSTNYEAAIDRIINNYNLVGDPAPEATRTVGIFLSDGKPTSEENSDNDYLSNNPYINNWNSFISANIDQLDVIGVGAGANEQYLDELSSTFTTTNIVLNENDLNNTLQDTIVNGVVTGNALDNIDFNADGNGQIDSIKIGTITYTASDFPVTGVTTPEGAVLKFDFSTGDYSYSAKSSDFTADVSEVFTVKASDVDGDETIFNITINVDVDASPAILSVSVGNEVEIENQSVVNLYSNDFSSNNSGNWIGTGIIDSSKNYMQITGNESVSRVFDFGSNYANQEITLSFNTDIDKNKWDESNVSGAHPEYKDYFKVYQVTNTDTEIYNKSLESNLDSNVLHTISGIMLDSNGRITIKIEADTDKSDEYIRIDNFLIKTTVITTTYEYDINISALLTDKDGSEVLSNSVSLANLPAGTALQDSLGNIIPENIDGTYTVIIDENGEQTVTLISPTQISDTSINDITGTVTTTELHGGDITDTQVTAKVEIIGDATVETITGTNADELIDGKAGSDTIDASGGNDTIVFDKNDASIDGGVGKDTLVLDLNDNIDFSALDNPIIKNIESIDLNAGNHNLTNLTLQDVIDMTDSTDKTLRIIGDAGDAVQLTGTETNSWNTNSTQTIDSLTYDVYTNSEDTSYKVLIQTPIVETTN